MNAKFPVLCGFAADFGLMLCVSATQPQPAGLLAEIEALKKEMLPPVGNIVAWHNGMNLPEENRLLPKGWMLCNGSKINDPLSPLNGQALPDLNGRGLFLRGAKEGVGKEEPYSFKSFTASSLPQGPAAYRHKPVLVPKDRKNGGRGNSHRDENIFSGEYAQMATSLHFKWDDSEVHPKNMAVTWIMRIR